MKAPVLAGKKLVFAPILRAGVGFLDGMLSLVPSARVAHIGLYRDPKTLVAVEYYFKAPEDVADRLVLVLDPMLATANSAIAAVDRLKEAGAKNIRFVCLLAAPEGIEKFHGHHPEVHIWTAAIDEPPRTITATSCRAWATRATGCTGRSDATASRAAAKPRDHRIRIIRPTLHSPPAPKAILLPPSLARSLAARRAWMPAGFCRGGFDAADHLLCRSRPWCIAGVMPRVMSHVGNAPATEAQPAKQRRARTAAADQQLSHRDGARRLARPLPGRRLGRRAAPRLHGRHRRTRWSRCASATPTSSASSRPRATTPAASSTANGIDQGRAGAAALARGQRHPRLRRAAPWSSRIKRSRVNLLGMSFLSRVRRFEMANGRLVMEQ